MKPQFRVSGAFELSVLILVAIATNGVLSPSSLAVAKEMGERVGQSTQSRSLNPPTPAPACALLAALSRPDRRALIEALPLRVQLPATASELKALFELVQRKYKNSFDNEQAIRWVGKIQAGRAAEISKKQYKALKEFRKSAQTIRSSFGFFVKGNEVPAPFDDFVRYFGKMISRAKKSVKEADPTSLASVKSVEYAGRVLAHLQAGMSNIDRYEPKVTSVGGFNAQVARVKVRIYQLLAAPELTVHEYHELRKRVRDFKVLYDLMYEIKPSTELKSETELLAYLDGFLGGAKDEFKDEEDAFKVANLQRGARLAEPAPFTAEIKTPTNDDDDDADLDVEEEMSQAEAQAGVHPIVELEIRKMTAVFFSRLN